MIRLEDAKIGSLLSASLRSSWNFPNKVQYFYVSTIAKKAPKLSY